MRRGFAFALVALVACLKSFALPSAADAQQPASPRQIGVLQGGSWSDQWVQAFRQGLLGAGYTEGRDVVIVWRPANGDYDRLQELSADLVRRKVDVLVADGTVPTRAAKRATSTIPIVMSGVADPVGSGFVADLAYSESPPGRAGGTLVVG